MRLHSRLKEVERKEEDPDDGNEYIGYVNKKDWVEGNFTFESDQGIEGVTHQRYCGYDDTWGLGLSMGSTTIPGFKTLAYSYDSASPGVPISSYIYFSDQEPYSSWVNKHLKITNLKRNSSIITNATLTRGDGGGQLYIYSANNTDIPSITDVINDTWAPDQTTFTIKIEAVD